MANPKAKGSTAEKAARYLKLVEWSDEDDCFVGRCPGLFFGGVHGDNEAEVMVELCRAVFDAIAIAEQDGTPLPPPTAGRRYSGKFVVRMPPDLHERASIQAMTTHQSLNDLVVKSVRGAIGS